MKRRQDPRRIAHRALQELIGDSFFLRLQEHSSLRLEAPEHEDLEVRVVARAFGRTVFFIERSEGAVLCELNVMAQTVASLWDPGSLAPQAARDSSLAAWLVCLVQVGYSTRSSENCEA